MVILENSARDKIDQLLNLSESSEEQLKNKIELLCNEYKQQDLILTNLDNYIVLANMEYRIEYINKSGVAIPRSQFYNMHLVELIDDRNKEGYRSYLEELREKEETQYFTYTSKGGLFLRVKGKVVEMENQKFLLLENSNLTDFVNRKLVSHENEVFTYQGSNPLVMMTEETKIISTNEEFLEIIGSDQRVDGYYFSKFIVSPQIRNDVNDLFKFDSVTITHHDLGKPPKEYKITLTETTHPEGSYWIVQLLDKDILRPVTEEVNKLMDLTMNQNLVVLGRLSAQIAHDFNNLLTGILGTTMLLKLKYEGSAEIIEEYTNIERMVIRGKLLLDQILNFSHGSEKDETQKLNPVDEIQDLKQILTILAGTHKVIFNLELTPNKINISRIKFQQVIMKLISNAQEAMADTIGRIKISVKVIEVATLIDTKYNSLPENCDQVYEISVQDEGIGMTDEQLDRMFELFYTTKSSGRGLGLSIILDIMKQYKGAFRIVSSKGEGTTASIYFPIAP